MDKVPDNGFLVLAFLGY